MPDSGVQCPAVDIFFIISREDWMLASSMSKIGYSIINSSLYDSKWLHMLKNSQETEMSKSVAARNVENNPENSVSFATHQLNVFFFFFRSGNGIIQHELSFPLPYFSFNQSKTCLALNFFVDLDWWQFMSKIRIISSQNLILILTSGNTMKSLVQD